MKTTFTYDYEAAVSRACEYSEDPETLRKLIARLEIEVGPHTVIPSPWNGDNRRPLKALHMLVTVNGYTFSYYGSHYDAEAMGTNITTLGWNPQEKRKKDAIVKARKDFRNGLLYLLLSCVRCDCDILHEESEDLGFNSDSIKDMAKWNEIREHARKLQSAIKLSQEELESLPS